MNAHHFLLMPALLVLVLPLFAEERDNRQALEDELKQLDIRRAAIQQRLDKVDAPADKVEEKSYDVSPLVPATDKYPQQRLRSLVAGLAWDLGIDAEWIRSSAIHSTVTIHTVPWRHRRIERYLSETTAAKSLLESRGFEVRPQVNFDPLFQAFSRMPKR